MAWVELLIAGFFEVLWAISLKYSENFTKLIPSVITVIGLIASFLFLEMAAKLGILITTKASLMLTNGLTFSQIVLKK